MGLAITVRKNRLPAGTHTCKENLRAQAEASTSVSSNHFTILLPAKIPHMKTRYDFRFLATVP